MPRLPADLCADMARMRLVRSQTGTLHDGDNNQHGLWLPGQCRVREYVVPADKPLYDHVRAIG